MPSFFSVTKALIQLGPRPLALNALYRFGLRVGHFQRVDQQYLKTKQPLSTFYSLFSLPNREQLENVLGQNGLQILLAEADEIASGKFRMFGGELAPLQLAFDARLQHWSVYEIHPQLLSTFYSLVPDIKFIWEPARFGWAFTLGRAYVVTQDEKYAEAFWKYFEIFNASNPSFLGPHWMNGQEVALRMMAFVWAAQVFETAAATSAERRGQLIQSIHAHAARIPSTLLYARSQNNNHLVTESVALYTAGLFFKNRKWRALGWRWLNWSFQHQISSYGEYIQHSTNYHRVMMQAALWIHAIKKDDWPFVTMQSLTRAAHWLFSMLDSASGRTPNLGANDGALIFPLSSMPFNDFRPTVQAAARAFLRTGLPAGVWDELSLWFGLRASEQTSESDAYLSDHLRGKNSWAYLRASRFKSRLSHMDQLHLDLWWRGFNVAQDAGTYLYNAAPPWDNPLVTTRVHNTVMVDGRDQMTRAGRFLTLDWFPAYSKISFETDENILQRVIANHKGYRRFGVRHERTVTVCADERWIVTDGLLARGSSLHVYRLHWLLMDGEWEIENHEERVEVRIKSPYGWIKLLLSVQPSDPKLETSLVRAGELLYGERKVLPFEGWVSPTYGVKIPALSLAVEVKAKQSVELTSEFEFPK